MTHASDRLQPGDAVFLYFEKKDMPLHIGGVFVFDGPISVADFTALVESKLPLIPRYRQRVVFPPLNAGHPTWEFDPDFNIHNHIHHLQMKHGALDELETMTGEIYGVMMDRNRPLWDLTIVDGFEGGRSALITRVHHCLVDGVAGVALMNVILDFNPEAHPIPSKEPFEPPPIPDAPQTLLDALVSSYSDTINRVLSLQKAALNMTEGMLGDLSSNSVNHLAHLIPELFTPVRRLPFNQRCMGPRKVSWAEFSMVAINAVREPYGAKVNDVAMAILTGAIRQYTRLHRLSIKGRLLRLMAPVNLRRDARNPGLGNMISILPVNIPLDILDPVELLCTIHEKTEALKRAHVAEMIILGVSCLGIAPASLQALGFGTIGNDLPIPLFNMVCTNVAGPVNPLYALGRKMLTYYPYVPIGSQMGANCAIASYNGTLYFGLSGDSASAGDLGRMRDFLYDAFAELQAAAGLAPAPQKRTRKPNRPARARQQAVATAAHS